jgi:hypothetical protein
MHCLIHGTFVQIDTFSFLYSSGMRDHLFNLNLTIELHSKLYRSNSSFKSGHHIE